MTSDARHGRIVSLGEALIDLVAVGEAATVENATTFHKAAGGAPANVAVGLARLGRHVAFVGKISSDAFGQFLRRTLEAEGVDTAGLVMDPSVRTPLAFVGAGSTSERSFVFYHHGMADTLLRTDELDRELISSACIFHFGSVTLAAEPGRTATIDAARLARGGGALVSFDPNVRLELWQRQDEVRDRIIEGLHLADVVKVSLEELRSLTGAGDPEAGATELRTHGPRLAVVTLGAGGAYFQTAAGAGLVPGFAVASIDATGAGDAFVAALISEIAQESEPLDALDDLSALGSAIEVANAAGALATTQYGAIPSLPRIEAINVMLDEARSGGRRISRAGSPSSQPSAPGLAIGGGRRQASPIDRS